MRWRGKVSSDLKQAPETASCVIGFCSVVIGENRMISRTSQPLSVKALMGSFVVKNGAANRPDLGCGPTFMKKLIVKPVEPVFAYNSESAKVRTVLVSKVTLP